VPAGDVRNGFFRADGFDPADADVPGARLLGAAQEAFLTRWAGERPPGTWVKLVLSQSPFTAVHTLPAPARTDAVVPSLEILPEGALPPDDLPVLDADSNGWPQTARDRALRIVRRANALHLAGDQHLGTVVRYGIDAFRDGPIAFTSPAVANTWPRRWLPSTPGADRRAGDPPWTGDFRDGFGNRITVLAVANPRRRGAEPAALHDRSPGYGIVRLDPATRRVVLEAWPRAADPRAGGRPYAGWPITFRVERDRWVRID
ncbi:MAG: twin-arginine translocation pathway signal protein, partial [Planctomycetota bacterium JB042]